MIHHAHSTVVFTSLYLCYLDILLTRGGRIIISLAAEMYKSVCAPSLRERASPPGHNMVY